MNSIDSPDVAGDKSAAEEYFQKNVSTFLFLVKLSLLIVKTSGACN